MTARVAIRGAASADVATVSSILREAASWLDARGDCMWRMSELAEDAIRAEVSAALFWIASIDSEAAGVVRFQSDDPLMWPDAKRDEAAYVHRLAVRRQFAGGEVSHALLDFASERTRSLGRPRLRLDCDATRPRLRAVYERYGFTHHSDHRVGPYLVARYELPVARST